MNIQTFSERDIRAVVTLGQKYARVYPDAKIIPGEQYLSPAFHQGQDVFCAYDGPRLLAYAPLYLQAVNGPLDLPHNAWVEIMADPDLPGVADLKDALLECLFSRVQALAASLPPRGLRVSFQYTPGERQSIAYVESRGFQRTDSVFSMLRNLSLPIPDLTLPSGIALRQWKMSTEAEIQQYVTARNECFPQAPITVEEWRYFLGAPQWDQGTTIAAFAGEELVGNVSVYWNPEENADKECMAGSTEDIFVRKEWRGRGIAGAMIAEGMRFLNEHGLTQARLEVRALNEDALGLYRRLGYQIVGESCFYQKAL